jgi:hypothetical protein
MEDNSFQVQQLFCVVSNRALGHEEYLDILEDVRKAFPDLETRDAFFRAAQWFVEGNLDMINHDCADNFRIARIGNVKEEELYNLQRDKGCCGFFDTSYYDRATKQGFLVGCNYGH